MADFTGRIVVYLDGAKLKLGWVTEQSGDKLRLQTPTGRQEKSPAKSVILDSSQSVSEKQAESQFRELEDSSAAFASEVELELLWEFAREEEREYDVAELAELLFGESRLGRSLALASALLDDTTFFKRKATQFAPRTADHVEKLKLAESRRAEKEEARAALEGWIREVLRNARPLFEVEVETVPVPTEFEFAVQDWVNTLYRGLEGDGARPILAKHTPEMAKEILIRLLRKVGRLDARVDPFLPLAGIKTDFPPEVLEEAKERQAEPAIERTDYTAALTYSIDDLDTVEIDDALSVELLEAGGARVGIHIADVSAFVRPGDLLDEEARERGQTAYLPRGSVTMLPPAIGTDRASLNRGVERGAVTFELELGNDYEIVRSTLLRTRVRVDERFDYKTVDDILESGEGQCHATLEFLDQWTRQLEDKRRQAGALLMDRREVRLKVDDSGSIALEILDPSTPAYRLVRELMILYNQLVADYARTRGLSFIFRSQDPPDEPLPEPPDQYDPSFVEQIFRAMKPSRLSLDARKHSSLGIEGYTQATSPLRRYGDLAMQRQLVANLEGGSEPHAGQDLYELLSTVEATSKNHAQIERQAKRHWTLKHFEELGKEHIWHAWVIRREGKDLHVEIEEIPIRALLDSSQATVGQRLPVILKSISYPSQKIRFAEKREGANS